MDGAGAGGPARRHRAHRAARRHPAAGPGLPGGGPRRAARWLPAGPGRGASAPAARRRRGGGGRRGPAGGGRRQRGRPGRRHRVGAGQARPGAAGSAGGPGAGRARRHRGAAGARPDPLDADLRVTLAQACRAGDRLRLGYTDRQGRVSERRVDPYRLVRYGPRWYLVARDVERSDWRTFRLDRVSTAVAAGGRADLSDPPDPLALVARGMALGPYPLQARVRLALGATEALDVIPRTVRVHTAGGPEATVVELGGGDVAGMVRYLAGLGLALEVLGPAELRDAFRAYGQAVAALNR